MQRMYQKGFTLIELIIVIVILGILAAVAAPRFLDFSRDANVATLEAGAGAMQSAANLVYAKAVIEGLENNPSTSIDLDNDGVDDIDIAYGYPTFNATTGIPLAMGSNFDEEWGYAQYGSGGNRFQAAPAEIAGHSGNTNNNIPLGQTNCFIVYLQATAVGEVPDISITDTGC